MALMRHGAGDLAITASLTLALMPPIGWAFLTIFLAQIVAAIGWGGWFPWSVPALFSELAGPRATQVGLQSYIVVAATLAVGLATTFLWWQYADHTR